MKNPLNKYNYKKIMLWSLGAALASAPLALAASCGSSDEKAGPTSIDTSQVAKPSVSVTGTTGAPVVNTNGFVAPANTVLKFKIGSSGSLSQAELIAYITANATQLTDTDFAAATAHLEPISAEYKLTDAREAALLVTFTKPVTPPVDTSNVNLAAITLSGSTAALLVNLNGVTIPANALLRFKVGASAWLSQADFVAYIIANAEALSTADLAAAKARLEAAATASSVTDAKETLLTGIVTKVVDTNSANLSVIKISGTPSAPLINLNGFAAPSNTVLRFQVGSSTWIDQASLLSYITNNAATLTAMQLSAIKARLEPASSDYSLTKNHELTLSGAVTTTAVDTDAIDLSVITIGGTTADPIINLNNISTAIKTGADLRFKVGGSEWLENTAFINYIKANTTTLTVEQLKAIKARLVPISIDYTLKNNREVTLTGLMKKMIDTSGITDLGTFDIRGPANNATFFSGIPSELRSLPIVKKFKIGDSDWIGDTDRGLLIYIENNWRSIPVAEFDAWRDSAQERLEPSSPDYALSSDRARNIKLSFTRP